MGPKMSPINIQVKNSTNLRELRLRKNLEVELPDGSTVGDLLTELGLDKIKEDDGKISSYIILFKNKKSVSSVEEELDDEDKIKIVPLASGG